MGRLRGCGIGRSLAGQESPLDVPTVQNIASVNRYFASDSSGLWSLVSCYYAKWTPEFQSLQDGLIRKIHGTYLAQPQKEPMRAENRKVRMVARDGLEPPTPAFSGLLTDNAKGFRISAGVSWKRSSWKSGFRTDWDDLGLVLRRRCSFIVPAFIAQQGCQGISSASVHQPSTSPTDVSTNSLGAESQDAGRRFSTHILSVYPRRLLLR